MARRPLRLLHTSDLHIGASPAHTNLDSLSAVVELAASARAQVVLMAGDVFDNNRVDKDTLDQAVARMASSSAKIVILPGNHDCLLAGGVYEHGDFASAGVAVLGATETELAPLHDLGQLFGAGLTATTKISCLCRTSLTLTRRAGGSTWRTQGEADEERAYRIFTADIDGQRADYLALGHWDVFTEVRSSAPAYYSGSPLYARSVNMVELSESEGLRVTRLPVEC
jgi:DNA repair protein SbcD/Mre11